MSAIYWGWCASKLVQLSANFPSTRFVFTSEGMKWNETCGGGLGCNIQYIGVPKWPMYSSSLCPLRVPIESKF